MGGLRRNAWAFLGQYGTCLLAMLVAQVGCGPWAVLYACALQALAGRKEAMHAVGWECSGRGCNGTLPKPPFPSPLLSSPSAW